jgi:hypothetical protein
MRIEKAKFDFEYQGKKYRWLKTYQGAIDCTCASCKKFVKGLVKDQYLEEIQ